MSLAARLKADDAEESTRCWESMFQLQSCTGEVITFFMSGETYLGPGCCHAIRTIQSQCWPNLLASLGYTDEEGDILEGYCDAASQSPPILEPNNVLGVAP
ncbi:hypothetical protein MLD38_013338 [Melastoma candidum]|uniref:Uncharacterized protein n=1 Tax=Melastoma candidum TaxID=119954 RepID=A0ACB9RHQ4_9MYRT|nr:hypothetical protein MLD38_013338 [Melastoma candidum]